MMSDLEQFSTEEFFQGAFDRFGSPELQDFLFRWKIDLDEVESLKRTSAMIEALSDEAEVKQFTNGCAVNLWLDKVKQLLYDADDILDEYAIKLLLLKSEFKSRIHPQQTQQVGNAAPLTPSERSVSGTEYAAEGINESLEGIEGIEPKTDKLLRGIKRFRLKVRDINEKLNSVAREGVALGLSPRSSRPRTSSLVDISKVFGRDEDVLKIINRLLTEKTPRPDANDNNFSVIFIVGMGGLGKTTLAQLVYNHECVERHFDLKAWVCVSEDFNVVRLTKEILESATGSSPNSDSLNLDLLQMKLRGELNRKRFLLVLDDMWNNIHGRWDAFSTVFACGKSGSKILVTTRNRGVASMMRTDQNDHYAHILKGLSNEACFALFRSHAFLDRNSDEANGKLQVFGEEIMKKCKGLPLAIKTLAGVLRDKRDNSEWEKILQGEKAESGFTPASSRSRYGFNSSRSPSSSSPKIVFNFYVNGGNAQISANFFDAQEIVLVRNGDESRECVQVGNMLVNL